MVLPALQQGCRRLPSKSSKKIAGSCQRSSSSPNSGECDKFTVTSTLTLTSQPVGFVCEVLRRHWAHEETILPLLKDIPHSSSLRRGIQKGITVDYARSCFRVSSQTNAVDDRGCATRVQALSLRWVPGAIRATCKGGSKQLTPYLSLR